MTKIAVVTGTRAEYGLLKPLIKAIDISDKLKLQLLVTGMHLMPEFGNTYKQIEADGLKIDSKIHDDLKGDKAIDITLALGKGLQGFAKVFEELKPELLVLLGDRSEILMAAVAATIFNIPIAHIHGGEKTEGAYDEFIRHAITKMSVLHFASSNEYRNRIIQLGEEPNRVFNVGAIGVDSILKLDLLNKGEIEERIGIKLDKNSTIITFHPVTLESNSAKNQFLELLGVLDNLEETTLIFTKPNSDKGGGVIVELIDQYISANANKAVAFTSLGQLNYLSALQFVSFVIGNSSSGILEVPYFRIPTINIGNRQKGRISPDSVIHCQPKKVAIEDAIALALSHEFNEKIKKSKMVYGNGTATEQILQVLQKNKGITSKKSFFDLNPAIFEKL